MKILLPETNVSARGCGVVAEEGLQTLRPGERAGLYIPIPNRIVCSPGNKRKIVRAGRRIPFRNGGLVFMRKRLWLTDDELIERRRLNRRSGSLILVLQSHASQQTTHDFKELVPCPFGKLSGTHRSAFLRAHFWVDQLLDRRRGKRCDRHGRKVQFAELTAEFCEI